MQTFLPYPDFERSASVLDDKRLGKQRVETLQILRALTDATYGWQNHPAVNMWRGSELYLFIYGKKICEEWAFKRNFADTCWLKIYRIMKDNAKIMARSKEPNWLGNRDFHFSHQSNLIRKNPEFYKPIFGSDIPDNLPYVWPKGVTL